MAGRKERYTAEEVVEALRVSKGRAHTAARRLGCDVTTIYNYRDRYKSVRAEMEMQEGLLGDTAEFKMIEAIHNGKWPAIKYYLSTKCKDRGYVERQEFSGPDGGAIPINPVGKPPDYRNGLDALAPHDE